MKNKSYNFYMIWNNLCSLVYTKLFWQNARIVRYPIRITGKKHFVYGKGLTIGNYSKIDILSNCRKKTILKVGKNCVFGDMLHIAANEEIVIGDNLLAASRVFITDSNHGEYSTANSECNPLIAPIDRTIYSKKTIIGDNVWIGENVSILAGVQIGDGCVIAANSVVTKSFDKNCIIAGNPAKIIKFFDNHDNKWKGCNDE